ncbi:hypothetical protein M2138_001592 [Dysgonomonadaceae bacterium PH5-43]|nr:hypothetical protein [Dysgonomonadaceae bacterium PH5-43]
MKKFVLFGLLALLFSSCEDDVTQVVEPGSFSKVYSIHIDDMERVVDESGAYFFYSFKERELTNYIFNNGVMQAFLYYKIDGKSTLCPLPFSDFIVDEYNYKWEEQLTVEFQPGYINFILKLDDHAISEGAAYFEYDILVKFLW